jgi:hypothetical protein
MAAKTARAKADRFKLIGGGFECFDVFMLFFGRILMIPGKTR